MAKDPKDNERSMTSRSVKGILDPHEIKAFINNVDEGFRSKYVRKAVIKQMIEDGFIKKNMCTTVA